MTQDIVVAEVMNDVDRANDVRTSLVSIKKDTEASFLKLCDLLLEAQEKAYHVVYGYARFTDWLEEDKSLDMSPRQAFYYVKIASTMRTLELKPEDVREVGISKLKEIFVLDPNTHPKEIKKQLLAAPGRTLNEVKEAVSKVLAKKGEKPKKYMTLKLDSDVKDTLDDAIELARRNYGDVVVEGEVMEASVSQCMELIAVAYLQDPNNKPESESVTAEG